MKYGLKRFVRYTGMPRAIRSFILFIVPFLILSSQNKVSAQDSTKHILSKNNEANFYSEKVNTVYPLLTSHFKKFEVVKISCSEIVTALKQNKGRQINIGLQISDELGFNLQLVQNDIIANNYILTTQTAGGKITARNLLPSFYKGKITDSDGGDARLCIKADLIYGFIKKGNREYFIDPLKRYDKDLPEDEFIVYEAADVIGNSFPCGFKDLQNTAANIKKNEAGFLRPDSANSTQNAICKKVKFLIAADYSMYKSFNNDIDALQTFLLANLNMAEGLFNTLNLDPAVTGDIGSDLLKFEVVQMHVSVCDSCDFMDGSDRTGDIINGFSKWINENSIPGQASIYQFWSTRKLRFGTDSYLGLAQPMLTYNQNCSAPWMNLIKYFTQDPITLRLQVSHEAGHGLGCRHDNEISPSVTGFIMNASGTYAPTGRFSRLSDFGGINYSSQQEIRNTVIKPSCFEDCAVAQCEAITGLKINYYPSSDSVRISWTGSGNYNVKYKIKDTANYDPVNTYTVAVNEIVLKNLSPCTNYTVDVKKTCAGNSAGPVSTISFNSSPFSVTVNNANLRGDVYDLKLHLECKNCGVKNITVNIDHHPYFFSIQQFPATVTVPGLFADGARHRLDYDGDNTNGGCKLLQYYHAPYYRENSSVIINDDFNSCNLSGEWKDSLLRTEPNLAFLNWRAAQFAGEISSLDNLFFYYGNLDSTCMAFDNSGAGSNGLFSRQHDITKFKNIFLSFDYKYECYVNSVVTDPPIPFFKVQVFNGSTWHDVFTETQSNIRKLGGRKKIWDTLPQRKFIRLDEYINSKFQLRFILDDGGFSINPNTGGMIRSLPFLYLDNIKVDGYSINSNAPANSFSIFPNPVRDELFINFHPVTSDVIQYKLLDVLGRVLRQEKLVNFKIDVRRLASGVYFLALFNENGQLDKTVKFVKH